MKSYPLLTLKKKGSTEAKEYDFPSWDAATIPFPVEIIYEAGAESLLVQAMDYARQGCVVLWIENTVDEAQKIYNAVSKHESEFKTGLLHSRFTAHDRFENEEYWVDKLSKNSKARNGCFLVSTQVCEQSLDIDADVLYTKLCPTDMLLQRIGRLWRHRENDLNRLVSTPKAHIIGVNSGLLVQADKVNEHNVEEFQKSWGSSAYVYEPYYLCKTAELWSNLGQVKLPEDMRGLIEQTYSSSDGKYAGLLEIVKNHKKTLSMKAEMSINIHSLFTDKGVTRKFNDTLTGFSDDALTRNITTADEKVCLLQEAGKTIFGETAGYFSGVNRAEVKENVLLASINLPQKSVRKLENYLLKDGNKNGIPGDRYSKSLIMCRKGKYWVVADPRTDGEAKGMSFKYSKKTGWIHG